MDTCQASGAAVRKLVLRNVTNLSDVDALMDLITLEDDFTVDGLDRSINKTTCGVTYHLQLRRAIGRLAESGRTSYFLNTLAHRTGQPVLSGRATFSVQPTSKPGQTWVKLLR